MKQKSITSIDRKPKAPVLDEYIEPVSVPPWHGMTVTKSPTAHRSSFVITREYDVLMALRRLTSFVHRVGTTQSSNFHLIQKKRKDYTHRPDLRPEGRLLISFLQIDWGDFEAVLPGHVFNPYVASFIATMRNFTDLVASANHHPRFSPHEYHYFVEALHRFVDELRERLQSAAFKGDLHTISKRCRKNYRSGINYVRSIFRHRGTRHLAIRLDLAYQVDKNLATGNAISAEDARRHIAAFVRHLSRSYPVTGFLWSLEYGLFRGYHFHFLVFLNGHLHQQDSLAWQLGKIWEGPITDGLGIFFNCNATAYLKHGVGLIKAEDTAKRDILEVNVLPYLTKADFLSSIKGGRWFGKGDMPVATQTRAGRPRLSPRPRFTELTSIRI